MCISAKKVCLRSFILRLSLPSGTCPQEQHESKGRKHCLMQEKPPPGYWELHIFFPSLICPNEQWLSSVCPRLGVNTSSRTKVQFPDGDISFHVLVHSFSNSLHCVYLGGAFSIGPALSFFLFLDWNYHFYLFPWRWFVRPQNTLGGLYHFLIEYGRIQPLTH